MIVVQMQWFVSSGSAPWISLRAATPPALAGNSCLSGLRATSFRSR